ncbi:MAG: transcriptional repressor [Desulfovibrio sp.]|uniref:Fur family transcriptional regulator n=1 Tax=Desulfovibrio sp. TaxID=885 RepID=UPI001A7075B0|nr:transcriptional repressor [Desulfovibrio sp.]MBD5416171.1 transcriptional repressor [Desulfovibrio sp.]
MPAARTRMTRQRAEILAELRKAKTHPTAEEIHAKVRRALPRISLGTVYRNLELLAQAGEILRFEGGGHGRRFDGDVSPHLHVRCVRCGRVADVCGPAPAPALEGLSAAGFAILGARIELDGLCESCAATADPAAPDPAFSPENPAHGGSHE